MKKWLNVLTGTLLLLALVACGSKESSSGPTIAPDSSSSAVAVAATPAPSATVSPETEGSGVKDLLQKVTDEMKNITSYATEATISQTIKTGETTTQQDMSTTSEIILNPLAMHQVIHSNVSGIGEQVMEQYITEEVMYTGVAGQWMKMSGIADEIKQSMAYSNNPEAQLEQFTTFLDDIRMKEEGGHYVMSAELSGNQVLDLAKSFMGQTNAEAADVLNSMNVSKMNLVYTIDKNTYRIISTVVDVDMDMAAGEQSLSLQMRIDSTMSRHNEIQPIQVPQDVLDSAQEFTMPEGSESESGS